MPAHLTPQIIRVYTKSLGKEPDFTEPVVLLSVILIIGVMSSV
jgi:ribosome-interacting GTPase 1